MSKQTAVDYLFETICGDKSYYKRYTNEVMDYITHAHQKAKAMEREQIIKAHGIKTEHDIKCGVDVWAYKNGEDYYNETYKGGEHE